MGILRLFSRTMARISTFRPHHFALLLAATLAVMAFYYLGAENQNFSSTTKRIKQSQASLNSNSNDAGVSVDIRSSHHVESAVEGREAYHALMMFTKIDRNKALQSKFEVAMRSMARHGRFLENEVLVIHYVSDAASKELGVSMLPELLNEASFQYEVRTNLIECYCSFINSALGSTSEMLLSK